MISRSMMSPRTTMLPLLLHLHSPTADCCFPGSCWGRGPSESPACKSVARPLIQAHATIKVGTSIVISASRAGTANAMRALARFMVAALPAPPENTQAAMQRHEKAVADTHKCQQTLNAAQQRLDQFKPIYSSISLNLHGIS